MAYLAHGECEHCGFVGDMWWRESEDDEGKIAACPVCLCDTREEDMADYPSA